MTARSRDLDSSPSARRASSRPKAGGRGRSARRPTLEALEGRSLLSAAGGPDFSFSPAQGTNTTRGLAIVDFVPESSNQSSITTGEALQADGKVVVVGQVQTPSSGTSVIALTRLTADGTVDTMFGTKGVVEPTAPAGDDTAQAVAIQPDGKIVVLATTSTGSPGSSQVAVYRLNADGSADTTFGTAGVADFQFQVNGHADTGSTATTLALQADGKILVGAGDLSPTSVGLVRFNADGTVDATFGTSGQALITINGGAQYGGTPAKGIAGLVVQAGGKIDLDATVLANSTAASEIAVVQLNADGSADPAFGAGGQVFLANALAPNASNYDTAEGLAIQPDGKLVVVGNYVSVSDGFVTDTAHFDVYRLNADGSADTTFGTKGEATPVAYSSNIDGISGYVSQDRANEVAVQPDGEILVGGDYQGNVNGGGTPVLVRLNADGSPDTHFGFQVQVSSSDTTWAVNLPGNLSGLAIQPDGKILAAVSNGVARLLAVGAANDFNEDGISDPAVLLPNHQYPFFVYRPSGATAGTPDVSTAFGTGGPGQTLPAPGAYDGQGIDELGVYLPAIGAFAIRSYGLTDSSSRIVSIGLKGLGNSIPAPADYTGSGFTQVGVFEPGPADFVYATGSYSFSSQVTVQFGTPGAGNSIPVPADYDGSGVDELAVYLPASASFAYRPAGGGPDVFAPFGTPGAGNSIPAPADYSGSGHTELAVYLPAIGAFAYRPYGTDGTKDVIAPFGMPGAGDSIPMPGDYDGSGHVELAVYMPTLDEFAYRPYGTDGSRDVIISFGQPGAGNTVPFNAQGAEYAANGSGGGGGGLAHPSAAVAGWVDFVPDPAGTAKKGAAGQNRN